MRTNTSSLLLLLAAVLALGCGGGAVHTAADRGDNWANVLEAGGGHITVLFVPSEGFAYEDADGGITGVSVEIMKDFVRWLVRKHGVRLTVDFKEDLDWRRFYARVRDAEGGVFGLGNVTVTAERRREIAFSPPYLTNMAVLVSHAATPELERLADLASVFGGQTALSFEGTLHQARIHVLRHTYYPQMRIEPTHSSDEIIRRLTASPGYFAYLDIHEYWQAAEAGLPIRRHPVGDEAAEEFGIIMPLDSDWQAPLAEFFEADGGYRETEDYRELLTTHLGAELAELLEAARKEIGQTPG